jgi:hypothetical protein
MYAVPKDWQLERVIGRVDDLDWDWQVVDVVSDVPWGAGHLPPSASDGKTGANGTEPWPLPCDRFDERCTERGDF